jgi:formylglycine-generating enzyme required for sulfatase activity
MKNRKSLELSRERWARQLARELGCVSLLFALLALPTALHGMTNAIQFVKIADPGNPPDARTSANGTNGSVAYKYYVGKYPIRNDQWVEFLDSVIVSTNDPYGLSIGHDQTRGGYTRTIVGTNYVFALKTNYEDKPVNNTRFDDACRFCNWLHNGAIPGANTEDGAYDMTLSPNQVRKPGARYFLLTKDEWYKAAFYEPGVVTSTGNTNYWLYATRHETLPGGGIADLVGNITNGPNNVANWADPSTPAGSFTWDGVSFNVSTVGSAGSNSATFYGAYDMNGDVYQWTETMNPAGTKRSYYGGSTFSGAGELPSTLNLTHPITGGPAGGWWDDPSVQSPSLGFRVGRAAAPDIEFVTVGNPGNPADARTGGTNGSVAYTYAMSKYPLRVDQYVEYLNNVASPLDPHNVRSGTGGARGGVVNFIGAAGEFSYGTKPNYDDKPVNWTLFDQGCRFCNYLHNGGVPGADTEDGAYDMSLSPNQVRKPGARYFLPTHDEWYKAAFYEPGVVTPSGNTNYWLYATRTETLPSGGIADDVGNITNGPNNVANWADPSTPLGSFTWDGLTFNVSTVGSAGSNSVCYYGAYDMNGNVYEWTETMNPAGTKRSYHGGSAFSGAGELPSTLNYTHPVTGGPPGGWWDDPTVQAPSLGFRVAKLVTVVAPPMLSVSLSGNQLTLTWSGAGFRLQENSSLTNPAGWTSVPGGTSSPTVVTTSGGPTFFRLISP